MCQHIRDDMYMCQGVINITSCTPFFTRDDIILCATQQDVSQALYMIIISVLLYALICVCLRHRDARNT